MALTFQQIKKLERLKVNKIKGKGLVFQHGLVIGKDHWQEYYDSSHLKVGKCLTMGAERSDTSSYHAIVLDFSKDESYKVKEKLNSKSLKFITVQAPLHGTDNPKEIQEFVQKWLDPSFRLV